MKMLEDNVLIAEVKEDKQSAGGIILTESVDNASKPGLVLSVGPHVDESIQPGQRVFLEWRESMPVNVEGKAAVIIRSEYIRAVLGE
tara:strand:+ start:6294 stop:6554 length:261 start_codon:yes stop_codon:yes gene_type:complete